MKAAPSPNVRNSNKCKPKKEISTCCLANCLYSLNFFCRPLSSHLACSINSRMAHDCMRQKDIQLPCTSHFLSLGLRRCIMILQIEVSVGHDNLLSRSATYGKLSNTTSFFS